MHEHKFNPKQIGPLFYDWQKLYSVYTQCTCTQSIRTTHAHTHAHTFCSRVYRAHGEVDKREWDGKKVRAWARVMIRLVYLRYPIMTSMNHVLAAVPLTTVGCSCCCVYVHSVNIYNVHLFIKQDIYKQRALSPRSLSSSLVTVFVPREELRLCANQIFTASNFEEQTIHIYTSVYI